MKASVIVLNYNGKRLLEECLSAVLAQKFKNFEAVLADNHSTDGSVEYVRKRFPNIRIIENEKPLGFAEGNNAAIRKTKGDYVVLLNNDAVPEPGWLGALVSCAEDEKVGMVASKMIFYRNRSKLNSAGIRILRNGTGKDIGVNEPIDRFNKKMEVFGPCAGAALYRRELLEDIAEDSNGKKDYLDSTFFAYHEDTDLACRARRKGWRTAYCPDAVVYHHGSATNIQKSPTTIYYQSKNRLKMMLKNYSLSLFIHSLPWILFREGVECVYYTIKYRTTVPLRARIDFLKDVPETLRRREMIKAKLESLQCDR